MSGHTVKDANPYTASPLPWWLTFIEKVQLLRAGRLLQAVAILTSAGGANLVSECSLALYSTAYPALRSMKSFNSIMYQDLQKKIVSANNEFMPDRHPLFQLYLQIPPPISLLVLHPKLICYGLSHQVWSFVITQLVIQESPSLGQKTLSFFTVVIN